MATTRQRGKPGASVLTTDTRAGGRLPEERQLQRDAASRAAGYTAIQVHSLRIIKKLRRSLKRDGFFGMVALCFRNLHVRQYDHIPSAFDAEFGLHTEGRVELGDLDIESESEIWGQAYAPTPPSVFDKIMSLLPEPQDFTFVDLGSGKGRAVFMAARRPFRSVIGVEFSRQLCDVAEANLEKFRRHAVARQVQIVCADAALFDFPRGPLVVYCYFAFTKAILLRVLERLSERQDETIFVYYNAHYDEAFRGFELFHSENALRMWRRGGNVRATANG